MNGAGFPLMETDTHCIPSGTRGSPSSFPEKFGDLVWTPGLDGLDTTGEGVWSGPFFLALGTVCWFRCVRDVPGCPIPAPKIVRLLV